MAAELYGAWPSLIYAVLIVLLPKSDGGRRPIGLFHHLVRIWARARSVVAKRWEAANARPQLYGGVGMGAQRAAWQAAFRAENAALCGGRHAQALLDLVKAFETVSHAVLVRAAARHGFSPWLLRMSLAAYRLPRAVGMDGAYSRLIVASRGITAGSVFATTELRVVLLDAIDITCARWPSMSLSVYVDDATLEAAGQGVLPAAVVAGATDTFVQYAEDVLELTVSVAKSVTNASSFRDAALTARLCRTGKLKPVRSTKLLGAPAGGGRRRCVRPHRVRMGAFVKKARRIKGLRKAGVSSKRMLQATGAASISYGWDVMGISDTALRASRAAVATTLAPAAGGKNPDIILMVADCAGSSVDPAYDAFVLPIKRWALAWWQGWQPPATLDAAMRAAVAMLRTCARSPWDKVAGPAAALAATVWRLGWGIVAPDRFVDDLGNVLDCRLDSPAAVHRLVKASVARWQFREAARHVPACMPTAPDFVFDGHMPSCIVIPAALRPPACVPAWLPQSCCGVTAPLGRLLASRTGRSKTVTDFTPEHRQWIRSAVTGGQWPQVRVCELYPDETDTLCQLCHAEVGTLQHRHRCQATMPHGGWPAPPKEARDFISALDPPRALALQTRGFLALDLRLPRPRADGWSKWLFGKPEDFDETASWYTDGSLVDGPHPLFGRTGFAIVVVGRDRQVAGVCYGAPPSWVTNAAGAEAWALYMALRSVATPPRVITDCLGLLRQLQRGLADATAPHRPLARLWRLLSTTFDGQVPQDWLENSLLWMPAHTSKKTAAFAKRSDGRPLTRLDWRSNRLADAFAKAAASNDRLPFALRALLRRATAAADFSTASLGLVTRAANSYRSSAWGPDGALRTTTLRDAWLPPYLDRSAGQRKRATGKRKRSTDRAGPAPPDKPPKQKELLALEAAAEDRRRHAREARARAKNGAEQRAAEAEGRGAQAWLADQALRFSARPPDAPTAATRLEALRLRIAAKARQPVD